MVSKNKVDINQNFEMLKQQMQKKKKLAEENIDTNNEENIKEIPIQDTEELAIEKEVSANLSKIVIKKVIKEEAPKRITYYLKPDTIKKIDKFSKMAGMGKSEFVQKILDEVLDNLEIEK